MGERFTGTVFSASEESTRDMGAALAPLLLPGDVIVLSGDLGAGKTQFTKGLAHGLEVTEPVTSPTFNILLVHEGTLPLYHFDLYRLDDARQLDDLDYYGVTESDGVSVVEWGDRFPEAMPDDVLLVRLRIAGDTQRNLEVEGVGARACALAREWLDRVAGGRS